MPEQPTDFDLDELSRIMSDGFRWASLSVSIEDIARENKPLIRELSKCDVKKAAPLLASLLTIPEYQSNCIRIEILVSLAAAYCHGRKNTSINQVGKWFSQIGKSKCVVGEDPAEEVFASLVHDASGDYRILEGVWEATGFYTQQILDIISTMPNSGQFGCIKKTVRALLTISDSICERSEISRYQLGSDVIRRTLSKENIPNKRTLTSRLTFSYGELEDLGTSPSDIEPFILDSQMRKELPKQEFGISHLERCPIINNDSYSISIILPTAISVAVRDYIINFVTKQRLVASFDESLSRIYSDVFLKNPLLGGPTNTNIEWEISNGNRTSNIVLRIDEGYFVSLHLFTQSIRTHQDGGFKNASMDNGVLTIALQSSINKAIINLSNQDAFEKGLIILVGCGWGKGFVTQGLELNNPHWKFENISAADLIRLSLIPEMSPKYFWRIHEGLDTISRAGVHISNQSGILNLIGWVRSNDGHFVPHSGLPEGEISPTKPLRMAIPSNLLRNVRAEADHSYDRHSSLDNANNRHVVQRANPNPFFTSKSAQRVYASINDLNDGVLTSVYEGSVNLWTTIVAPNILEKDLIYQLWEMGNQWLHRIGEALENHIDEEHLGKSAKVFIEFRDSNVGNPAEDEPILDQIRPLCCIEPHTHPSTCKIVFQAGFLTAFSVGENIAERLFSRTLTQAYLHLLGSIDYEIEASQLEPLIVPNIDARNFHLFRNRKFIDNVRDSLPSELIAIDSIDDAATKIGLGWRVLQNRKQNTIEGIRPCTKFLEKVVDELLSDISATLEKHDRLSTLNRIVANCEKAYAEEDHWKRTSAAILGLHGSQPDTTSRFVEQLSNFAGASISSRVLIEISLCVCPTNKGKRISDIDLSKLIASASLIIKIGGLSDAIHYNALTPKLTISPLGDILFQDDFGRTVVEPALYRSIKDRIIADAPRQRRNYEELIPTPTIKETFSDEFWNIWNTEMGFSIDEARNIIDSLEELGIDRNSAILHIDKSEYLSIVISDTVSESSAISFLNQFSLTNRKHWNKPPTGFKIKDIYPWRFGRRLSFVTRPILKLDKSDNPLLIIPPNALRKGFAYVLDGTYSGRFEQDFFQTKDMRNNWWGKASEGHSFTAQVAKVLSRAGWLVRENIRLTEILNKKTKRDYGDVDVIAWRPDREEVLAVECKDLSSARNYSEMAALLSEYQGTEHNGKPDKLKKHLDRVALLKENRKALQRFTKTQNPQTISYLVCSEIVPMQYAKIEALNGIIVCDFVKLKLEYKQA